ncbi:hypothetical protein OSTOST_03748 [Ostertagia ostertagi]
MVIRYGFAVPLIIYCHNEKWRLELKRLKAKFFAEKKVSTSVSVRSALGQETHIEKSKQADVYFGMLNEALA